MKLTKKLLYTSIIMVFLVSMALVNVASASPDTYFWMDPSLIEGTPEGKFEIAINIAAAPSTYAWEIYLSWKPDRLELVSVTTGDFLHRWYELWGEFVPLYKFSFAHIPLDEANAMGEILIASSLVGDPPELLLDVPVDPVWASGDGLLVTLEFVVQAAKDIRLNLFDARLWDHYEEEYPAPTPYRSEDSFVYPTSFYCAGLAGWKLKVNGASGGKTTVGTPNLLEAMVDNTGTFDVEAQAFFEIRSEAGYWIATVPSSVETLTSGGSTTLSAYWTADGAGVYYITAYLFYGELAPTIPDGFSRARRLEAV